MGLNHAESKGLESPHWRCSLKIVITSAYSESFNSSGFDPNPISRKFYKMICEMIDKVICSQNDVRNFLDFLSVKFY